MSLQLIHWVVGLFTAAILLTALFSAVLRRTVVSDIMIVTALGILLGPHVTALMVPEHWGNGVTEVLEMARLTLAAELMGLAISMPLTMVRDHARSIVLSLTVGMLLMWLTASVLAWLFLPATLLLALAMGATITPTDPVLSATAVHSDAAQRNLPARLRDVLRVESGANDGLALALVTLPIFLTQLPEGRAFSTWALRTVGWEVLGAATIGALMGYVAGWLISWARKYDTIEQQALLAFRLALPFVIIAALRLLDADAILAVFAAGLAFSARVTPLERVESREAVDAVSHYFFILPTFLLFGLVAPIDEWLAIGWALVGFAAAVLVFRRLPWWLLMQKFTPAFRRPADAAINGWFGPIGVASLFYVAYATQHEDVRLIWSVGTFVVLSSVMIHGLTAMPISQWYGRRWGRDDDADEEPVEPEPEADAV